MIPAFLGKLFSFLSGFRDPEREKKKMLKRLARDISASKHSRFYKPRSALIDPSLGAFFYEMYQTVAHAPVLLQNAPRSDILREITVEAFLDIKYLDARQRLSADYVAQQAQTLPLPEVSQALQEDLAFLSAAFEGTLIADIDECYNQILALIALVSFDFFLILKKFDPGLAEQNFDRQPRFQPVKGEVLSDHLKDFLELSSAIDPDGDWTMALRVLRVCKNDVDVVAPEQWNHLLSQLKDIGRSGILELMIRHIDRNPAWQPKLKESAEHITQGYLNNRQLEARNALNGCLNIEKNAHVYELAVTIFNDPNIKSIRYYTDKHSEIYEKRNFEGFTYAEGINYLKIFLFDIFEKDILPLCEMLLIRGQWASAEQSQKMSNSCRQIRELCDQLSAFDDSLSDEGEAGARLRAAISRVDRNKNQERIIARILRFTNAQALYLINTSAQALIVIGQNLKNIYEDYPRDFHEFILNWEDLEPMTNAPILQQVLNIYKRIYNFLQLMRILSRQAKKPALKAETAVL
ncbi:hypothetical protein AGMMS49587_00120 [Spirochaetia bacterium]|nr:hypothetical protein AGMMS49587_00120 [Spirochaetia bacterium]